MEIKKAINENCKSCNRYLKEISPAVFGCDNCRKPIDFMGSNGKHHHDYLELTVFTHKDSETKHLHLCGWKCVFKKMRKIKTDYFVSFPFVTFEKDTIKGQRVSDFLKCIKP